MTAIDSDLLRTLPLAEVRKVTFYKHDEMTTLICCDVEVGSNRWTFHEDLIGWEMLLDYLQKLPGFKQNWFTDVSQPPFAASTTVAFQRK